MTNSKEQAIHQQKGDEVFSVKVLSHKSREPRALWRQLNLRLHNKPADLKLHTQRILFCVENEFPEFASAALHDMYIALQESGWKLRLRMFNLVSPIMEYTDRLYFQKWLAENTDVNLKCRKLSGSIFVSKNCLKNNENNSLEKPIFDNKVEESRFYIEQGDLNKAQSLLEAEYFEKTSDSDTEQKIREELQMFYYYSKNKQALETYIVGLKKSNRKLSQSWVNLQNNSVDW